MGRCLLVPPNLQDVSDSSIISRTQEHYPSIITQTRLPSSSHAKTQTNGSTLIRTKLKRQGLPNKLINIIETSWKPNTTKQYNVFFKKWEEYCNKKNLDPLNRDLIKGLEFLRYLLKAGYSYSALNTARSALSCIFDSPPFGEEPLVVRFMKSAYIINPPLARYDKTWDVSIVLKTLEKWSPARFISRKQITFKLITLLTLVTGQRVQSLQALDTEHCHFGKSQVTFTINKILKHNKTSNILNNKVIIPFYDANKKICPALCLKQYIERTKKERSSSQLFIGLQAPYKPVSSSTISRWIKLTLGESGVNTDTYKSHSTRSASTSAAAKSLDISVIMKAANWSRASTFSIK